MKIQVIQNGIKFERGIPTSWDDVTFDQFLKLRKVTSEAGALSVFTGIDMEILIDPSTKLMDLEIVFAALKFLKTEPVHKKTEKLLGYDIPKDLGFESIAQFEDVKAAIKEKDMTTDDHLNKYPLYCAIYACKPYDWKKAEQMHSEFFNAPCQEVLAIGNFTLAKLIGLRLNIDPNSLKQNTRLKKFKLALTVLRMRLDFIVRSFFWKKKLA